METIDLTESSLQSPPDELRARAHADGYLFLRGLLQSQSVNRVRKAIADVLAAAEICDVAEYARDQLIEGVPKDAYRDILKLESVNQLPHQDCLVRVWEIVLGAPILIHANKMPRCVFPSTNIFPTPPHQDWPFVQGAVDTWTCWIPLQATPRRLGGLAVYPRSHRLGRLPVVSIADSSFGVGVAVRTLAPAWASADYEIGDVILFHSLTVHRGLPNRTRDIRMSMDCRAQRASDAVQALSLRPHVSSMRWSEVYAGWKRDRLKHYWRNEELRFAPYDSSVLPDCVWENVDRAEFEASADDTTDILSSGT